MTHSSSLLATNYSEKSNNFSNSREIEIFAVKMYAGDTKNERSVA